MIGAIAFWLFLLSACAVILAAGDAVARAFVAAVVAATIATFVANLALGFLRAQPLVLLIDLSLLAFAGVIVVNSRSFWPIWFTGFHSITVATEIAKLLFPNSTPQNYVDFAGFWALPALGCAAVGVFLDHRSARASERP